MFARRKAAPAAILFTALTLLAVNIGWWWYYRSITTYLEEQLSQRLAGVVAAAGLHITADQVENLLIDDLNVYANLLLYLDSLAVIDSLSEAAVIDLDFNYMISTRSDLVEGGYLLARPNFDSLHQTALGRPTASALYNIDGTYLKSAYAPLYNSDGDVAAVLVAEAGAGYFDLLNTLRRNLFFLAGGSAGAVVILLIFYIIYSRRMAAAEEKIYQAGSQAALGRMVAVVSHEIKNPLMIIAAAGERLEKKHANPEASFITEEVARLDSIVSGYLSFARGDKTVNLEPVNLATLCGKIIAEFRPQFDQENVELQTRIDDSLPPLKADRIGLRQVLINLLLNALHAVTGEHNKRPEKLVLLEVLTSDRLPDEVIIRVCDSGPGIKPAHRERLFEPFFTTRIKGSGLGLYLSRRIIESHNGTIRITDDKEGMTTFEVILPAGELK
jgi:signal transduction histidine kinase